MGVNLTDVDLGDGFLVAQVTLGRVHSCVLSLAHLVKCFGDNSHGRLGLNDTMGRGDNANEMGENLPALYFPDEFKPVTLSAGHDSTCAASESFEVMCWGRGAYGMMQTENDADSWVPTKIEFSDGFAVVFVEVGYSHGCAGSLLGRIEVHLLCVSLKCACHISVRVCQCWGRNNKGQTSTAVLGDMFVIAATLGQLDTCVLAAAGCVHCFGNVASTQPIDCSDGFNATALSSGSGWVKHHFAVSRDGSVRGWGENADGQLGVGDSVDSDYGVALLMDLPWLPTASPTLLSARTSPDYLTIGRSAYHEMCVDCAQKSHGDAERKSLY